MASIRERIAKNGAHSWAVLWRENRVQRSVTYPSQRAAERAMIRIGVDNRLPADMVHAPVPDVPTFADALDHHLRLRTGITDRTPEDYRRAAQLHILPTFGRVPVDMITAVAVADWVNALARKRSAKTVRNVHSILSATLTTAVREGWASVNVAKGMTLPRVDGPDSDEMTVLTVAQYQAVTAELPERWVVYVDTLVGTGMRFGELTALTVQDFDLDTGREPVVRVVKAWKQRRDDAGRIEWYVSHTKTKRGNRTITLHPALAEQIRAQIRGRSPKGLAFPGPSGDRLQQSTFWKVLRRAAGRSGVGIDVGVHDLRHTHVSWLIHSGEDIAYISRRLGHEKTSTTWDTYGHLVHDTRHQTTAQRFGAYLELEA